MWERINVPYDIGTYLIKEENGQSHLDQINKYIFDANGLSVILILDVETNPRLSTEIKITDLLKNWKEDRNIHVSSNHGTCLNIGMDLEEIPKLRKRDKD